MADYQDLGQTIDREVDLLRGCIKNVVENWPDDGAGGLTNYIFALEHQADKLAGIVKKGFQFADSID